MFGFNHISECSNGILLYLICINSNSEKEAWSELIKRGVSKEDLIYLMRSGIRADEAWELLKQQKPNKKELISLVLVKNNKWNDVFEELIKVGVNNNELIYIILCSGKKSAFDYLVKQGVTNEQLLFMLRYSDKKYIKQEVLKRKLTDEDLKFIKQFNIKLE